MEQKKKQRKAHGMASDGLLLLGAASITVGTGLVSLAAGLIVCGLLAIGFAVLISLRGGDADDA